MLSEAEIHYASEAGRVVRCAAYSGARTPGWGNSVILGAPALGPCEVVQPVEAALCPIRREPRGELVRVHFDTDGGVALSSDCKAAIRREIAPFIVGVGEVVTEDTPEGFKVFLLDDRDVLSGHDCSSVVRETDNYRSENEITAEMIDAGGRIIEESALDISDGFISRGDVAIEVYRAMMRLRHA